MIWFIFDKVRFIFDKFIWGIMLTLFVNYCVPKTTLEASKTIVKVEYLKEQRLYAINSLEYYKYNAINKEIL